MFLLFVSLNNNLLSSFLEHVESLRSPTGDISREKLNQSPEDLYGFKGKFKSQATVAIATASDILDSSPKEPQKTTDISPKLIAGTISIIIKLELSLQ